MNLSCVFFLQHIEAQVLLGLSLAAVFTQAAIHQRVGFVRLLGISHVLWIPMFAWMGTRLDQIAMQPNLQTWLAILFVTNLISLIIDAIDVTRYVRGERQPHYSWD